MRHVEVAVQDERGVDAITLDDPETDLIHE